MRKSRYAVKSPFCALSLCALICGANFGLAQKAWAGEGIFGQSPELVVLAPAQSTKSEYVFVIPADERVVPRIRPRSLKKQYPFGLLREDYTPYGMAGVPDRKYFARESR